MIVQRKEHKKYIAGKSYTITKDRIKKLEKIGIEWTPREIVYEDRLEELQEYRDANGDCNVPLTSE